MTTVSSSPNKLIEKPRLTFIPKGKIDLFQQAAVQQDADATQKVLKDLFGIEASFDYTTVPQLKAVYGKFKEVMSDYKTDINPLYSSPVHFAAASGSMELLSKITNFELLNAKDQKGLTPLHYAIASGQKEAILHLLNYTDLNYLTPSGDSYLHYAAQTGDRQILNAFLNLKFPANHENQLGLTAAHFWAYASDDLTGLKRLVRAGAPLHSTLELSPIGIQILKTIEANPDPLSSEDIQLFAISTGKALLGAGIMNLPYMSPWPNYLSFWTLYGIHEVLGLAKQEIIGRKIAPNSPLTQVVGIGGALNSKVMGFMSASSIPAGATAAASTAIIAKHAFNSLTQSKHASTQRTLMAIPIHLTNIAASLFDGYLAYQPLSRYDSLDPVARMTDPNFTSDWKIKPEELQPKELAYRRQKSKMILSNRFGNAPFGTKLREQRLWDCERANALYKTAEEQYPHLSVFSPEAFQNLYQAKNIICYTPPVPKK